MNIDSEFKKDASVWQLFLENAGITTLCRPFVDRDMFITSTEISFYTDALGKIGYGGFFDGQWIFGVWNKRFLDVAKPSIGFLEIFALVAGVLTWGDLLVNTRVVIFCDNQSVLEMVNNTTSSCKNCMYLLRLLVLNNLRFNRRISVKYVKSADNILADSLSRLKFDIAPKNTRMQPDEIPEELWPIEKFWMW